MNKLELNRRRFIKGVGAIAILLQVPLWQSCQQQDPVFKGILPKKQQKILHTVLIHLFPVSKHGPDIQQLHTEYHINAYLTDSLIDPDEKKIIINGIVWIDETAHELYKTDFVLLKHSQQVKILENILQYSWGESWLSKLLTLTFESLLLDPIYKINTNETGWHWLQHQTGQPRPNSGITYPEILNRKKELIIITNLTQL